MESYNFAGFFFNFFFVVILTAPFLLHKYLLKISRVTYYNCQLNSKFISVVIFIAPISNRLSRAGFNETVFDTVKMLGHWMKNYERIRDLKN